MVLVNVVDGRSFCCIKISERNRLSPILLQTRRVPFEGQKRKSYPGKGSRQESSRDVGRCPCWGVDGKIEYTIRTRLFTAAPYRGVSKNQMIRRGRMVKAFTVEA
jgi:hypothetical protein